MFGVRQLFFAAASLFLTSCGTYVPEIQEFWGTRDDATYKVNKIASQVACELRKAVQTVVWEPPPETPPAPDGRVPPRRDLSWFVNKWAVQVTLNLNIIENSSLTPGVTLNDLSPSFTLGLGGTASSTATRNDKLNMFFTVKELLEGTPSIRLTCRSGTANADLFLQSDLKIYDWLHAALLPHSVGIINYANNTTAQNAITHDIKFQIVSNGSVNPQWKLVKFSANTGASLVSAGRDRTQELIITFGPTQQGMLAPAAANSHLATETGSAISQAIQSLPVR